MVGVFKKENLGYIHNMYGKVQTYGHIKSFVVYKVDTTCRCDPEQSHLKNSVTQNKSDIGHFDNHNLG